MKRVFLSFKMEDKKQVDGIRLMAWNDKFDLEFYDESVRVPYKSENAQYIRSNIRAKIQRCTVTVGFMGQNTHLSEWVNWELNTSIEMQKRIVLIGLPNGPNQLTLPAAVRGYQWYLWSPETLARLIEGG